MNGWTKQTVDDVEVYYKDNYTSFEVYIPISNNRFFHTLTIKEGTIDEMVQKAVKEFKTIKK
jgi:hypothetical protein